MSQNVNFEQRKAAINRLVADARLPEIASALGLRVISGSAPPRALCPFHNDEHPSLYLYPSSKGGRAQFHCYACGAHGDVFDLIKKQLSTDFRGALDWLTAHYGIRIPVISPSKRRRELQPRLDGLEIAFELYRMQSSEESVLLDNWSAERHFEKKALKAAEVFAVFPPKISRRIADSEREQFDALEAAGLLRRELPVTTRASNFLPLELPARDFFDSPRIIFTIRDERGLLAGFAGRALGNDSPKYLFSPGFPRGATLYRWHRVRDAQQSTERADRGDVKHVFVVEGLMDALRLESLGFDAVASLGSNLTTDQVRLLTDYARELDRNDYQLAVHLLFDDDEAGHRGGISATVKLLDAAVANPGLVVDVVSPSGLMTEGRTSSLHDPDEIFQDVTDYDAAMKLLRAWCRSPMSTLLSAAIDVAPAELDSAWSRLPDSQRLRAFRDVERRLERRATWVALLDRVPVFDSHLGNAIEPAPWQEPLSAFLRASTLHISGPISPIGSAERDKDARLIRALQIAEASTQRREFPLDEGSWDRLLGAADATLAHLKDLLANDSVRADADPMLAVEVPKQDGEFRFKALPSSEILTMQQYVLDELLRDYPDCPRFQRLLPAVRFSTATRGRQVETTGNEKLLPADGETVSFAYMLDMDVIEQRAAPRRTGMFRSYYQCWQDFIAYVDSRVAEFPPGDFHVARLDIRRFYDSVPRTAVNAVLLPAVSDALAELADSSVDSEGARECAPLFLPEKTKPAERAEALVDWLCDQSFDYLFEHPGTGGTTRGHTLPQGPDLSAYLANISLFPLDRALSEIVAQLDRAARSAGDNVSRGGVYARYVDDMVIIARTAPDLARLRAAIEKELSLVGMELNPKTDPLPVMDEAQVREWLTDRRGAGLGISGPFEGPPVVAPPALLEPLADAGETDRSDSLLTLYDPRLEDPGLPTSDLEDAIFVVRGAKDLRHGEQVACARHLWRCVLRRNPDITSDAAVREMITLWGNDQPSWADAAEAKRQPKEQQKRKIVPGLLALLDGIDRLLGSRPDRNPTLSEQDHESLSEERKRMATLVHEGICERLTELILPVPERARFLHMIELKTLEIHCAATFVCPASSGTTTTAHRPGKSRAKARLLISLAEAQKSTNFLDEAGWRAPDVSLGMLFHEAIARLRIANQHDATLMPLSETAKALSSSELLPKTGETTSAPLADPLMPVRASVDLWAQKVYGAGPTLFRILELWMPDTGTVSAQHEYAEIALGALVNLAPKKVVHLLELREALKSFALDDLRGSASRILPTPPGIDVPGLLGLRNDDRVILRADFWKERARQFMPNLSWKVKPMDPPVKWERSEAPLDQYEYLAPRPGTVRATGAARWLAKAFRSLAEFAQDSNELSCPPTAVNLLGQAMGNESPTSKWGVLGFCTPKVRLVGQAFLRHGTGGLALEPVLEQHDDLWRIGTALADWLGRAETSRSLSQRLSARAIVTEPQDDWATEAMLRFSLFRLRGRGLPTRPLRLASNTNLPITIERLLRRLETFPEDDGTGTGILGLAHLVATLGEGRAIQTRIRSRLDPEAVGGGAALLGEMVRAQFRADEELAQRLPDTINLPAWAPLRRPARSLLALAQRLELLAEADLQREFDPTIAILAAGTRLLAIEANLRAQGLELWSIVEPATREKFIKMPPGLAAWGLDGEALLHNQQTALIERALSKEESATTQQAPNQVEWRNVRDLFQQLHRATLEGQRVHWPALAGITPLGWLVVIGALSGALSGGWRGSLADSALLGEEGFENLKRLATSLALAADAGDDDLPWGGLRAVADAWTVGETQTAFEILDRLDNAVGLEVRPVESSRFHIEGSRRGPTEVQTSDGLRQLQGWTISWAKTTDESRGGIERVAPIPGEPRAVFRWSETWQGSRLISIGVVQPAMTALAGAAFAEANTESRSAGDKRLSSLAEPLEVHPASNSAPTVEEEPLTPEAETTTEIPVVDAASKSAPLNRVRANDENIISALGDLREMQEDSWKTRHEKSAGHARVALLQWDVDSSYQHPGFELCNSSELGFSAKEPGAWVESKLGPSCAEARRRSILESALRACGLFKVDILLLPEYSTRPETVAWLASNLRSFAPTTSVWAGTYRLPAGMSNDFGYPDWSAVHELVLPVAGDNRLARTKKYPSVAAGETFHPGQRPFEPLFADRLRDIRCYTMELICSEVFLVTSPANLLPLARSQRQLLRKFGVGLGGSNLEEMINQSVVEDIKRFANFTGLGESLNIRRTILLVPAMTSRTADYTVLGQAAFLSSGLTTVFCNAVCGDLSHGQSCFIGHNCWQEDSDHSGLPSVEPYHGERPGIFQLNKGQLGKEEQALLIADIDPFYSFEGKPRPQTLAKPLQLVAHLPIIEAWHTSPGAESA